MGFARSSEVCRISYAAGTQTYCCPPGGRTERAVKDTATEAKDRGRFKVEKCRRNTAENFTRNKKRRESR